MDATSFSFEFKYNAKGKRNNADVSQLRVSQKKKQYDVSQQREMTDADVDLDDIEDFYIFIAECPKLPFPIDSLAKAYKLFQTALPDGLSIMALTNGESKTIQGLGTILSFSSDEARTAIVNVNYTSPDFKNLIDEKVIIPVDKDFVRNLEYVKIYLWSDGSPALTEEFVRNNLNPKCVIQELVTKLDKNHHSFMILKVSNYRLFCTQGIALIGQEGFRVSIPIRNAIELSSDIETMELLRRNFKKLNALLTKKIGSSIVVKSMTPLRDKKLNFSGRFILELAEPTMVTACLLRAGFILRGKVIKIYAYDYG